MLCKSLSVKQKMSPFKISPQIGKRFRKTIRCKTVGEPVYEKCSGPVRSLRNRAESCTRLKES